MLYSEFRFGNAGIKVAGNAPAPTLLTVIQALDWVKVSYNLTNNDEFLKVSYYLKLKSGRSLNSKNVLLFAESMQLEGDLEIHNLIQHFRCDLHETEAWHKDNDTVYSKTYTYRVHKPNVPAIAELLEEWRLFTGTPYDSTVDDVKASVKQDGTEWHKVAKDLTR